MTDIEKYTEIMKEIKARIAAISVLFADMVKNGPSLVAIESSGLQFRKIFEQIAFASLAANRNEYSASYTDFSKHWEAAKLVRNLRRINPNFYPQPVTEGPPTQPGARQNLNPRPESEYLTESELVSAHGRCGNLVQPIAVGPVSSASYIKSKAS